MITYNHSQFIVQALESVVMQDYPGELEVLIYDDKSTDNTQELIRDYIERNQLDHVTWRPLLREANVGVARNFAQVITDADGEYVAILEGDDYWIVSDKLTRQYETLLRHPDKVLCHTNCQEVDFEDSLIKVVGREHPQVTGLSYVLRVGWFYRTATLFFRNGLIDFPEWYYGSYSTDYSLHLLLLKKGDALRLDYATAAYRRHSEGISNVSICIQKSRHGNKLDFLNFLKVIFPRYIAEIEYQKSREYKDLVRAAILCVSWDRRIVSHFTTEYFLNAIKSLLNRDK